MIRVSIFKRDNEITGFDCIGHAGYAEEGSDIVCAGVSVLVINAVNSIEMLAKVSFDYTEEDGDVRFRLKESNPEAQLLLQSMQLGIETVAKDTNGAYVKVTIVNK